MTTSEQGGEKPGAENQPQNMGALLDASENIKPLRRGEVVEGVVMRVDADGIHVNVGHKAEAFVPAREMRTLSPQKLEAIKVGDEIVTMVVKTESGEEPTILSLDRALGEQGWKALAKHLETGEIVEGKILGFNRGGAIVEVENIQGFVPASQLVTVSRDNIKDVPAGEAANEQTEEAPKENPDIGKVLKLNVIEVNRSRNRAIFSERQYVEKHRETQKAKLIEELKEGEVRKGRVTGISTFGAFVDLGGADGLVHISEMSWAPVGSPDQVVKVGQELDVFVLKVDPETKKIALSIKRLQPEPWATVNERFQIGDIVEGTVTKLTNFGAFARVGDGDKGGAIEGLIHISELTDRVITHPKEAIHEGDVVKLKVLRIEPERRRLGLSLRQVDQEEE
ncbi:MAG: S1 RNA-binding domain-containing protein, partial [Verrucomicrobia bacterium]|nr:S1 RNA-binding domain-containing protein [Verrucomicrobiota bacterium]